MAVALDSSAVIGFLDRSDALHEAADAKITELLKSGEAVSVSVITFAEVLTGAELGHHDLAAVRGFFDDLISAIVPVTREVAERASEFRGRRSSLRLPDALTFATAALDPDVDQIVCGDDVATKLEGLVLEVDLLRSAAEG